MNKRPLLIALAVIIVLALATFLYYRSSHETFEANQQLSDSEVKEIIAAVGSHIRLPADEEPLIATIADIELLLEREPFYQGAKNGDLLLLYPKAGKAILFDRDANIIINVGPIILDDDAAATAEETPTEESTETATDTEATTE